MRFCFIIEEQYRHESMPRIIAQQLLHWEHTVDLLEPQETITCLSTLGISQYDAYVLKTVSDGPGISILEAAEVAGIPTINNARAIRLVRDKAVATSFALAHGLPTPVTYFVTHPRLVHQIPARDYPIVLKPFNGSSGRGIYRLNSPAELDKVELSGTSRNFFLAQHYEENRGFDIKVYVAGPDIFAVAKRSPLHPDVEVSKRLIEITPEIRRLAVQVGKAFGLSIYGLDIVETTHGPVIVDINDFPSFGQVPGAVARVATYIVHIAHRAALQRAARLERMQYRCRAMIEVALQKLTTMRTARLRHSPLSSPSQPIPEDEIIAEETHSTG